MGMGAAYLEFWGLGPPSPYVASGVAKAHVGADKSSH